MNNITDSVISIDKPTIKNNLLRYTKVLKFDQSSLKIVKASIRFSEVLEWEDTLGFITDITGNNHPISKFASPRGEIFYVGYKEDLDIIYNFNIKSERLGIYTEENE
ncbi:MAG: hypothetical protein WC346_03890 [Methanogenium sp.]|jgi:hypothetical protein